MRRRCRVSAWRRVEPSGVTPAELTARASRALGVARGESASCLESAGGDPGAARVRCQGQTFVISSMKASTSKRSLSVPSGTSSVAASRKRSTSSRSISTSA